MISVPTVSRGGLYDTLQSANSRHFNQLAEWLGAPG